MKISKPTLEESLHVLRFAVPILLLGIAFWFVNITDLVRTLRLARLPWILLAFVLQVVAVLLQGTRWHSLLSTDGGTWPFWRVQVINGVSYFFDTFTPGRLGSDVYRVGASRGLARVEHLVGTLIVMRAQGLFISIGIAAIALALSRSTSPVVLAVLALLATMTLFRPGMRLVSKVVEVWSRTVAGYFPSSALTRLSSGLADTLRQIQRSPRSMAVSAMLAVAFVGDAILIYALVGHGFRMELRLLDYARVVPILLVVTVLPISVHGRGVTETLGILLWQGPHATAEQILLTCFAVYGLALIQALLGGALWAVRPIRRKASLPTEPTASPQDVDVTREPLIP